LQRDFTFGQLVIAALAWWACAAVSMGLSVHGAMVSLIWWPNGIAVAVLYLLPYRKWPIFLVMGLIVAAVDYWIFTMPPPRAVGIAVANFAEVSVVAAIGRHIMRGKHGRLIGLKTMFALVGAGLAGGLTSTAIMAAVDMTASTWIGVIWWCSAVTLGTLVATPLVLMTIEQIMGGRKVFTPEAKAKRRFRELGLTTLMVFTISLVVFQQPNVQLLFIPMAATIFAATRYGHIGATVSVLAISVASGVESFGGHSPAAFLHHGQMGSAVLLQAYMMVLLATSVPLAALLMAHDRLGARLRHRHARMRENLSWLGLAEETARIGRWRYNHRTHTRDWSRQMFLIYGMEPNSSGNPGEVKHMHPDGGKELFELLDHHAQDKARYSFEYPIRTPRGEDRILKMHAMNEFDSNGERISTFGVVMDVTDHHQRQDLLDKERTRAMRLAAEAQYLAQTDPLTGLANRRRTMSQLEKCIEQCETEGRPLALIMFDIDHFKAVNDTYGHQVGDEVLVRVAEIARGEVRASDLIGRTGGEEFVWLLPGAKHGEAENAADRLCRTIAEGSGVNGLPTVTASIGYAIWPEGDSASSLLGKADAALYEAKGAGRNRVQKAA
jgi:diguanylate cyclase (GGDEF)-like protein